MRNERPCTASRHDRQSYEPTLSAIFRVPSNPQRFHSSRAKNYSFHGNVWEFPTLLQPLKFRF
jgi:hypothetical protein